MNYDYHSTNTIPSNHLSSAVPINKGKKTMPFFPIHGTSNKSPPYISKQPPQTKKDSYPQTNSNQGNLACQIEVTKKYRCSPTSRIPVTGIFPINGVHIHPSPLIISDRLVINYLLDWGTRLGTQHLGPEIGINKQIRPFSQRVVIK